MTMTANQHTPRPPGSSAYYLGRPASLWIAAARRRRRAAGTPRPPGGPPTAGVPVVDPAKAYGQATAAGLVAHRADPLNAETPLTALTGADLAPDDRFYVRNHFGIPDLAPATWRLEVGGLAGRPLSLSLTELRAMPSRTVVATIECAGNGRSALGPTVPGEPWGLGAVGTAAWTGVPLSDVVEAAAPQPGARQMVFQGADSGQVAGRDGPVRFARSLPLRHRGSAGAL